MSGMTRAELRFYMNTAIEFGKLTHCTRAKVGAIAVKDRRIISLGRNGMPSGWDHEPEVIVDGELRTKPEVLHAESNCLAKIAKSTESSDGATMFMSLSPCLECSKLMHQAGIKAVYYDQIYRDTRGLEFLRKCGIHVERISHEKDCT